jgi:hypothetical protein
MEHIEAMLDQRPVNEVLGSVAQSGQEITRHLRGRSEKIIHSTYDREEFHIKNWYGENGFRRGGQENFTVFLRVDVVRRSLQAEFFKRHSFNTELLHFSPLPLCFGGGLKMLILAIAAHNYAATRNRSLQSLSFFFKSARGAELALMITLMAVCRRTSLMTPTLSGSREM